MPLHDLIVVLVSGDDQSRIASSNISSGTASENELVLDLLVLAALTLQLKSTHVKVA